MHDFHVDKKWYFEMQTLNAEKYVIPFIEETRIIEPSSHVLEVGCGEGGVLLAFIKKGCQGVGVDLDRARVDMAKVNLEKEIQEGKAEFYSEDIYHYDFEEKFKERFDLIVLKDVIEHIPNQENIMLQLKKYLKPNGAIYFGFPPFNMPFGGHQQITSNKLFSKLPYVHLLPMEIYKLLMKMLNVPTNTFVEIKETGISINRFEKICKDLDYTIENKTFYAINPIYEYKFGMKPLKQFPLIAKIPFLRDFVTTCVYYLIRK